MAHGSYSDDKHANQIIPSSARVLSRSLDLNRVDVQAIRTLLKDLISRLDSHFAIDKASLTFYNSDQDNLRLIHILSRGVIRSSLALTIPSRYSLLHQVLMQGYPIVDNYPELISQNVIEKKILLTPSTKSVAVIPLVYESIRLGILSLSSNEDSAFSPYLDGLGEGMVGEFVIRLGQTLQPV